MQQTILIVEDSPVNQELLSRILTKTHYRVLVAGSGEAALEQTETVLPDLIVLDIMLPGMDGYAICRQLKNDARTKDIPIIFISSLDATEDKVGAFEAGGVDYITKPFHPGEVLSRIHTHLQICCLQHELEEKNQQLRAEKQKSETLLRNVLPERVGRELLATGCCAPQLFTDTTVCFADIVDFTVASSALAPEVIIHELNEIFTAFDRISLEYKCERMKTIGDAYLFACGVPEPDSNHAANVARASMEMIEFLENRNHNSEYCWDIRVGINSGPLVGGVVGTEKYLYDIFGDTVNIAARMEELASPMRPNVSSTSYDLLKDNFHFSEGTDVEMKGKGKQIIYTLLRSL